jgi:hypothetical protein
MKKQIVLVLLLSFMVLTLFGCFPQSGNSIKDNPAGFFMGIWHGWIAPLTLIVSLFNHTVRIYETNNTGWWYDFGFYIAVIAGFGGLALSRKQHSEKH